MSDELNQDLRPTDDWQIAYKDENGARHIHDGINAPNIFDALHTFDELPESEGVTIIGATRLSFIEINLI